MNDQNEPAVVVTSARRRLIRGAFSVPAVLTVSGGSAFAAASNILCVQGVSPFPAVFSGTAPPTTDTIFRIPIYTIGTGTYVRGVDVPTALAAKAVVGFMTATQVWAFNVTTNQTSGSPVSTPSGTPTAQNKWAALRFDTTGMLVGVGVGPSNQYALTGSCWNSFV